MSDRSLMPLEVDCYSGFKADERPLRFRVDDLEYEVRELLEQWYTPEAVCFKLRASDGKIYVLRRALHSPDDSWSLET